MSDYTYALAQYDQAAAAAVVAAQNLQAALDTFITSTLPPLVAALNTANLTLAGWASSADATASGAGVAPPMRNRAVDPLVAAPPDSKRPWRGLLLQAYAGWAAANGQPLIRLP